MQAAMAELPALIQQAYPAASFAVVPGDDPDGLYVLATTAGSRSVKTRRTQAAF
jgi:hypothetical protein